MKLKSTELAYWQKFVSSTGEPNLNNAVVTAGYAGTPEITDGLLALYLNGKKTAGSSPVEDFLVTGDRMPQVGDYWIFLNSKGEPSLILKTEKTVLNKFENIPAEIAIAEGEGDLSVAYWKKVHGELYAPYLEKWGVKDIGELTILTEYFKIVFR